MSQTADASPRFCDYHLARAGQSVPATHFVGDEALCSRCFRGEVISAAPLSPASARRTLRSGKALPDWRKRENRQTRSSMLEGASKLERFVRSYGVEDLAGRLDVVPSAIYQWLRGRTSPHPAKAIKMQMLAEERGVVISLDEIYQHFREVEGERYTPACLTPVPVTIRVTPRALCRSGRAKAHPRR